MRDPNRYGLLAVALTVGAFAGLRHGDRLVPCLFLACGVVLARAWWRT